MDEDENNNLYHMLKQDMALRLKALSECDESKTLENNRLWDSYSTEDPEYLDGGDFQQWPQEGTTSTGGWIETTWHQRSPYNDFCPLDPIE